MKNILLLVLLTSSAAFAADAPVASRDIFPSDYTPSPCAAPASSCLSFTDVTFTGAANRFLLLTLDPNWVNEHRDEMTAKVQPYCTQRGTCLAAPGRMWWFCNDVFVQQLRTICDRYDQTTQHHDYESCRIWMETFALGVDQRGSKPWSDAQECTKKTEPPSAQLRKLDWWAIPDRIPVDYQGKLQIFAIDAQSHIPVQAEITVGGETVYSRDVPSGKATTYYTFKLPRTTARVTTADGHSDIVPATMTLTAPGYEVANLPVPTQIPKVIAKITPAKLKPGVNKVTITTTDAATGKPVEGQVYSGGQTIGFSNEPIEITVDRKQKLPEIWVRSPFDMYGDIIVVKP